MMNFRGLCLITLAAVAVVAAGRALAAANDAQSPAPVASPIIVHIKNFAFSPSILKIPVGASVTWKNEDSVAHTATSTDKGGFDSKNLDGGKSFTYTFPKSGRYSYVCSYHSNMSGKIVVGAEAQPSPTPTEAPLAPPSPSGY